MIPKTFLDAVRAGEADLKDVDDWIDFWHANTHELGAFLGLDRNQYELFVKKPSMLPEILKHSSIVCRWDKGEWLCHCPIVDVKYRWDINPPGVSAYAKCRSTRDNARAQHEAWKKEANKR